MKKKVQFVLSSLLILFKTTQSQDIRIDSTYPCSKTLDYVSFFWKSDSLANNGFRLYAYRDILISKLDQFTADFMIEKLGKPDRVWETPGGKEFVYYFLNRAKISKEYVTGNAIYFIRFEFVKESKFVKSIHRGSIDL